MAGKNKRQRKASFSLFSMFKMSSNTSSSSSSSNSSCRKVSSDPPWEEAARVRKVYRSDEDRRNWVAEPGIDWRASLFIAKFHEARMSEAQSMAIQQKTN